MQPLTITHHGATRTLPVSRPTETRPPLVIDPKGAIHRGWPISLYDVMRGWPDDDPEMHWYPDDGTDWFAPSLVPKHRLAIHELETRGRRRPYAVHIDIAADIKARYYAGLVTQRVMTEEYGVCERTVRSIIKGDILWYA